MPLKIHHPKNNHKHKQKVIIIQGKCDNEPKVTGELINTGTGLVVPGTKLIGHKHQWGYLYKGLVNGNYKFTVTQTNSPVISASISFSITLSPPPPPGNPPTVTAPGDAEEVGVIFYPYGTSVTNLSMIFSGMSGSTPGTVTQQPDMDGSWTARVDGIDSWPSGSGNLYRLEVTNSAGSTNINNLTIAAPPQTTPTTAPEEEVPTP